MSLIPKWRPTVTGKWSGFDDTATPSWQMIGHRKGQSLFLDFAVGKSVTSVHPQIADITGEVMANGGTRVIWFEGKSPGRARIEVRDPKTRALESTLIIRVKREKKIGLAFYFIEDKGGDKTNVQPGIIDDLIKELNEIYEEQTNITFESGGAIPLKINIDLDDVVAETRDVIDRKVMTGHAKLRSEWEWKKIFAANDPGTGGFNVFFVPADKPVADNDTLIFTDDKHNSCVIEDGRQPLIYTLAHAIGRMLGCLFTTDPNKMNQLMFWDPGIGKDFFSRSDNFIPRECANIMNS